MAEAGTARFSVHSFRISWPPTASASTLLLLPRGGTQPVDSGCVGPQGTKRAFCRTRSRASGSGRTKSSAVRKKQALLNMNGEVPVAARSAGAKAGILVGG